MGYKSGIIKNLKINLGMVLKFVLIYFCYMSGACFIIFFGKIIILFNILFVLVCNCLYACLLYSYHVSGYCLFSFCVHIYPYIMYLNTICCTVLYSYIVCLCPYMVINIHSVYCSFIVYLCFFRNLLYCFIYYLYVLCICVHIYAVICSYVILGTKNRKKILFFYFKNYIFFHYIIEHLFHIYHISSKINKN